MTPLEAQLLKFLSTPNIWPTKSVLDGSERTLRQWQVFEVQFPQKPDRTRHFVGYCVDDHAGQASSAIRKFDPATMRGVTQSARVYQLLGRPGRNDDAAYTWQKWKSLCRLTDEVDITGSIAFSGENEP